MSVQLIEQLDPEVTIDKALVWGGESKIDRASKVLRPTNRLENQTQYRVKGQAPR